MINLEFQANTYIGYIYIYNAYWLLAYTNGMAFSSRPNGALQVNESPAAYTDIRDQGG